MDNAIAIEEIRSFSDPKRVYARKDEKLLIQPYGHSHDGKALILCTNESGIKFITKEDNVRRI